ncbi:iron complex transport system ATP-binding protein [Paracoccus isoporae]|uniref:Iron complex transport system ATP-binding protein n=1 Tax=Paracoccus isoporae TaxID=591205 RepID=A0A1G6TV97_9RHOB|nr:ABC transporter ATP-binding protein [Paracoccus isoporae]SDD32969.1 iron complex transport system ATP-binding protein [Paracoccus isoporae]
MRISAESLTVRRGGRVTLDGASLSLAPGELVGLIGPNGAGKTTLMRAMLGLVAASGHSSLAQLPAARRAHIAAWLPQEREAAWPISVEALVRLGRIPHRRPDADHAQVERALSRMGLTDLRQRPVNTLSGGERARVLIARALAQDTPVLLADEPIAGLDPAYQIATMALFRGLAQDGRAVMASLHDLGLAARHCTRLVLMDRGRIAFDGPPQDALSPERLARIFGIEAHLEMTAEGPVFQPLRVLR